MILAPKTNVKALRDYICPCGSTRLTKDAIYFCEELSPDEEASYGTAFGPFTIFEQGFQCEVSGCVGYCVGLHGKDCWLCSTLVAPLNDGDTSLVDVEELLEYETKILEPYEA